MKPIRSHRNKLVLLALAACGILGATMCSSPKKDAAAETYDLLSAKWLNHSDSAEYIGMAKCMNCHPGVHSTFIHTGMGQSFGKGTRSKSTAIFNGQVLQDSVKNLSYVAQLFGEDVWIREFRLSNQGDTTHNRLERVNYIVGSGQHTNSHIIDRNGYLYQAPITWYAQKGKWDFAPGFEGENNKRFDRMIEGECITCHNGLPEQIDESFNRYAQVKLGIDCERCHGPGSLHENRMLRGDFPFTKTDTDFSIVNPAKLIAERQVSLCQRCHLQGNAVLKPGKTWTDFKPGMLLSDFMTVFLPRSNAPGSEFIMASHADRLQQSKCFIESEALTCISCHNPHVSVKDTKDHKYNQTCGTCHGKEDCGESDFSLVEKAACVTCHMPKSGSIDIPHVSITDHKIGLPIKQERLNELREYVFLESINEKHPSILTKAKAYIQQYERFDGLPHFLDSAASLLGTHANSENHNSLLNANSEFLKLKAHYLFLKGDGMGLVDLFADNQEAFWKMSDAWTFYRIAEAYSSRGENEHALRLYERCVGLKPLHSEFRNKLAVCLMSIGRSDEAASHWEKIIVEDPGFASAYCNLGYVQLERSDLTNAESNLIKAIQLDPDYLQAHINILILLFNTERYDELKLILKDLIERFPDNQQLMRMEKEIFDA